MRALPAGISVRRATSADIDSVMSFLDTEIGRYREWAPEWTPPKAGPDAFERLAALFDDDQRAWILLACDSEYEVVGVVSLSVATGVNAAPPPPGTVYLWQMFASRDWQGRGLGPALHDRVVEEARRRGYSRMTLWAAAGAAQARRFYEREGWTPTGETQEESGFGLPILQYALNL